MQSDSKVFAVSHEQFSYALSVYARGDSDRRYY